MSTPSQAAIDAAATLLSRYSSPIQQQAAEIIQAAIDAEKANAMKENIALRLAVGDDTLSLLSKLEAERKRVGELEDALAFYADTHNYHDAQWSSGDTSIRQDNGRAAREALKK